MAKAFDPGKPRVEYVELGKLKRWPKNPKNHDLSFLGGAYKENGFAELPHIDEGTGKMVAGHGRVEKLAAMQAAGEDPPERIEVRGGKWFVPVVRGMRYRRPDKHVLASNRGVELGGWTDELAGFLAGIGTDDLFGTGFVDEISTLGTEHMRERTLEEFETTPPPKKAWILICTTDEQAAEIEAEIRSRWEGEGARIEVSVGVR